MKFGSLFSGIGGLDLGLERAGMECRWQVEIDDYCNKVLEKHWPHVKRFRDIKTLKPYELEPVELICGGFPCQPVSVAGKRKGQADSRWLWPQFRRIVCVLRPRFVLIENVPVLLRLGGADVLRDLSSCGYDAEWDTIPAAAFGAPHLRYRVFIVAYARQFSARNESGRSGRERISGEKAAIWTEARNRFANSGQDVADSNTTGLEKRNGCFLERRPQSAINECDWWSVEPDVGRVAHGVPSRVDRLKALGNAVVPQCAEWIGRRILECTNL